MRKRIFPRREICERFYLIYELEGCQKAVDFLTRYYGIRRMWIVLNGKRVKSYSAIYENNKSYFRKNGLTKRIVLHELYHHIVDCYKLEMTATEEERNANYFARSVIKKARSTF
jgi:hypothetical protein